MPTETDRAMSEAEIKSLLLDGVRGVGADAIEMTAWLMPETISSGGIRELCRRLAAERRTVRELRAVVSGKTIHDVLPPQCESMSVAGDRCIKNAGHDGRHERMTMR